MKIIVAITGASGYCLGHDLVAALKEKGIEVHLIISEAAKKIANIEGCIVKKTEALATKCYNEKNLEALISSSTCHTDGMVVVPCSLKTLSAIANGHSNNLITRAAENTLRMKRTLVVMPRETPLSLQAIENMQKLFLAGAIIMPPVVAYYTRPKTLQDINNFFVGKVLDAFSLEHNYPQWDGI
ncbi:MAG: UbiX family flavin prenyltransferase [Candidatus Methanofastidiosia archaeon]